MKIIKHNLYSVYNLPKVGDKPYESAKLYKNIKIENLDDLITKIAKQNIDESVTDNHLVNINFEKGFTEITTVPELYKFRIGEDEFADIFYKYKIIKTIYEGKGLITIYKNYHSFEGNEGFLNNCFYVEELETWIFSKNQIKRKFSHNFLFNENGKIVSPECERKNIIINAFNYFSNNNLEEIEKPEHLVEYENIEFEGKEFNYFKAPIYENRGISRRKKEINEAFKKFSFEGLENKYIIVHEKDKTSLASQPVLYKFKIRNNYYSDKFIPYSTVIDKSEPNGYIKIIENFNFHNFTNNLDELNEFMFIEKYVETTYYNGKPVEKIKFRNSFISPDGDLILNNANVEELPDLAYNYIETLIEQGLIGEDDLDTY